MLGIIIVVIAGFVTIMSFEVRIVSYLKQMRDLLREILEKN